MRYLSIIFIILLFAICGYAQIVEIDSSGTVISGNDTYIDSIIVDSLGIMDTTYSVYTDTNIQNIIKITDIQKKAFLDGVKLYNTNRYYEALEKFKDNKKIPESVNRYLSVTDMMIIKTYLRLKKIEKTIESGYEFEINHNDSKYLDDVRYTIGDALMTNGKYSDAIMYFLNVLKYTNDEQLKTRCRQAIDIIVDLFFSIEELQDINNSITIDYYNFILNLKIVEKKFFDGNQEEAYNQLRNLRRQIKIEAQKSEYNRTVRKLKQQRGSENYIGVILPLSGSGRLSEVGKKILNGIRFSINQYRLRTNKNIAAIVMDNKGDMVRSIEQAEYLANNPKVLAIFGPVRSENTIAVAALLNQKKIPMITPTATGNDLTALGPWIFQANVNINNMGYYIGKYCTQIAGEKNFVTIAPLENYGNSITDAFSKMIDETNGRIVSQQWYNGIPRELKNQFKDIRNSGLMLKREHLDFKIKSMKDSLMFLINESNSPWNSDSLFIFVSDSTCQIYEDNYVRSISLKETLIYTGLMDSIEFEIPVEDSLEYLINSIDGFFIPSHASDLEYILPQLKYNNFRTKIYGSSNLYNEELLRKNKRTATSFIFVSDYYIDEDSWDYKQMVSDYMKMLGVKPERFELYGYDTMQMLLSSCLQKNLTRETIRQKLNVMPIYHGICRNISFQGNTPGTNSCAFILSYERNKIRPVAYIKNGIIVTE